MAEPSKNTWKRYRAWRKRHSRIGRLSIWLTEAIVVLFLLNRIFPAARGATVGFMILLGIILAPLLIVLLSRWITRRVLWKVRNRLIVTYLLMGLAPLVLFGTLAGITAYFLAGQFETNIAAIPIQEATADVEHEASALAIFLLLHGTGPVNGGGIITRGNANQDTGMSLAVLDKNSWRTIDNPAQSSHAPNPFAQLPIPAWLHPGFGGVVALDSKLYIVSNRSVTQGTRTVSALASMPLDKHELDLMAKSLGRVVLSPGLSLAMHDDDNPEDRSTAAPASPAPPNLPPKGRTRRPRHQETTPGETAAPPKDEEINSFDWLKGGAVPPRTHFYDLPVAFSAPLAVTDWTTGRHLPALINVISRSTVLYTQLFATSAKTGLVVRVTLISLAIFFGLIELFALWMALLLSRTITCSVADLYRATAEIDRGNLEHRVVVKRKDQLGALASSFNRMAASLQELLIQQREKDRLLNELSIAQEVQQSLFPHSPVSLPGLDLHAVCIPARTVSGDYFDFIFGSENGFGGSVSASGSHANAKVLLNGHCQLCIALGDISGKGISAALLMASLNSAVRAFSLGEGATTGENGCPSPARLLALLNRHLYRSTQPEKYATLFLAFYDTSSRKLTYSNAGHLPPAVISSTGHVHKLDTGGTVVGLLDAMEYEEATVELHPGDLLLAYSDGLTEPENNSVEFGEERLLDCVWQHRQLPLPALASNTLKTLQQWIGEQEQPDDMTIMLARPI